MLSLGIQFKDYDCLDQILPKKLNVTLKIKVMLSCPHVNEQYTHPYCFTCGKKFSIQKYDDVFDYEPLERALNKTFPKCKPKIISGENDNPILVIYWTEEDDLKLTQEDWNNVRDIWNFCDGLGHISVQSIIF